MKTQVNRQRLQQEVEKMSKKYEYHNNKISSLGDIEFTPKQEKYLEKLAKKFNKIQKANAKNAKK